MAPGPAWDDEDEPTVIRQAPIPLPPAGLMEKLNRRGTLWGVAGILPPLAFLSLVAVARHQGHWTTEPSTPEWLATVLAVGAIAGPLLGLVGGWLALRNGLRVHRTLTAAGIKHNPPAGLSLGWSAVLFGVAGLGVALWMVGRAAASLR